MSSLAQVVRCRAQLVLAALLLGLAGCDGAKEAEPEEGPHEPVVALTVGQAEALGLDSHVVAVQALPRLVEATAVVEGEPDRTAQLAARVAGRIVRVAVNEGDVVAARAVLATVESPELGQAKADFLAALAEETLAAQGVARAQALFRERITSERALREAEVAATRATAARDAAEARLHLLGLSDADLATIRQERHYDSTIEIRSPLGGVVIERRATVGATVVPTDHLFTVMDLDRVWVLADVYETQLGGVQRGQVTRIRTAAEPERVLEGRVEQVGATVEATTRAVKVRVVVDAANHGLKPGMFATVQIVGTPMEPAMVVVPREAVQQDAGTAIVFVVQGAGRYERRVVQVGAESGGWLPVSSGLSAGEMVITRGAFALKAEYRRAELGEGAGP